MWIFLLVSGTLIGAFAVVFFISSTPNGGPLSAALAVEFGILSAVLLSGGGIILAINRVREVVLLAATAARKP